MGQKVTEHPQADLWVKLAREADRAGATLSRRRSADPKEIEQFAVMQRARTRSLVAVPLPLASALIPSSRSCLHCSKRLSAANRGKLRRQTWEPSGSRIDWYLCRRCSGWDTATDRQGRGIANRRAQHACSA